MSDRFKKIIKNNTQFFDVLVGYFRASGFYELYEALEKVENLWEVSEPLSVKYILGILNSKLLSFYHMNTSPKAKKGLFPKILVNDVRNLHIYDKENPLNSKIIDLVDRVIELKKLNKDTQDLENQIDEMVYDLYELTEEEKELVREF
ncbi:TaqI-like C-terminal specificity domain-containing protein [Fusobacterium sp. SYSU M8D902]|uniref:TaqI-like C-terminal specificity domain-containing protein n=1 Tax=Fusobacterium sp. SYSU M8D902 TaxID=3159562 RepID=UPI0032E3CF0F